MVLYSRPITFTPTAAPAQTRYMPSSAIIRPISYTAPVQDRINENQPGLTSPSGGYSRDQAIPTALRPLTQAEIEHRSNQALHTRVGPYSQYIVQGGSWYGVRTVDGMEVHERLNPATWDTYPNPDYRYQTSGGGTPTFSEGSAGGSKIQPSAKPTPPPTGSTKKDWEAYAAAQASWEREQLWQSIPEQATWKDISDWYGDARFDLPTQERREWEIFSSNVPFVTTKQLAIEQQYAQQQRVIVSSSGNIVMTDQGWKNVTRDEFLFPTPTKASDSLLPIPTTEKKSLLEMQLTTMRSPFDTSGRVDMGKVWSGLTSPQKQPEQTLFVNPFQGVPVLEQSAMVGNLLGSMSPKARAIGTAAVSFGQGFFPTAPVLSGFYDTGQYVGLDLKIKPLSEELQASIPVFEKKWESKISGNMFTGTESEYSLFQKEYTPLKAKSDQLDALLGQQTALKQKMFGGKTPSTEQMLTYPVYSYAREFADWYGPNIAEPITQSFTETQQRYTRTYPLESMVMFAVGKAAVSEPVEAAAGVAMLLPGFERLAKVTVNEPGQVAGFAGMGLYLQAQGMYEGFTTQPAKTFVNLVYSAGYMHVLGRGASFISPIGGELVEVPTGKVTRSYDPVTGITTETPVMTKVYGIYAKNPFAGLVFRPGDLLRLYNPIHQIESVGNRALFGYVGGRGLGGLFAGSPIGAFGEVPIGTGYRPVTRGGSAFVNPIMESRLTPEHLRVWRASQVITELAMKKIINPAVLREYGLMKPKALSWDTWNRVLDYLEEHRADIVEYGSTTQSVYLPRSRLTLGDIDLDIRPNVAEMVSQDIYNIIRTDPGMRGVGPLTRETSQLTGGRWTARHPTEGIILDLHPHWQAEWDIPGVIPTTERGFKIMPMSETAQGKVFFSTNYREVVPGQRAIVEFGEGRFKDPADLSVIFGNLAEMEINRPLRWDINRLRFGARQRLAEQYLEIGRAYEEYVTDFVGKQFPEAVQYLQEAGFPARHANLGGGRVADIDVRIGAITEFVKTDAKFGAPDKSWKVDIGHLESDQVEFMDLFYSEYRTLKAAGIHVDLKLGAKILELGPGDFPFKETTHFIESDYIEPAEFTGLYEGGRFYRPRYKGKIGLGRDFTKPFKTKENFFDIVIASRAERTLFNKRTLGEVYRSLKPGGNLIFSGHMMPERATMIGEAGFKILESDIDPLGRGGSLIAKKPESGSMFTGGYKNILKPEGATTPVIKAGYYKKFVSVDEKTVSTIINNIPSSIKYSSVTETSLNKYLVPEYKSSWYYTEKPQYLKEINLLSSPSYTTIGKYILGGYRSSPVGKYIEGKYTGYPAVGKYIGKPTYKPAAGKYPSGGKYISEPTYPVKPTYKPQEGKYPPGSYKPIIPTYPTKGNIPTYLPKTLKVEYKEQAPTVSYPQTQKIESYLSTASTSSTSKTTTRTPEFILPKSPVFMFPITRKPLIFKEEEKHKKKLRLHFDVRGSKWIIKNPIPRPEVVLGGEKGKQYKNELKVYDIQRTKKTYTVHAPFDIITDFKVTKGLRF